MRELAFLRRFVLGTAEAGFNDMLEGLSFSKHPLSSDASASFGMAGVLRFGPRPDNHSGVDGLFLLVRWADWEQVVSEAVIPENIMNIHIAENLALLITCETFAKY